MIPIRKNAEPAGLAALRQQAIEQGLSPEEAYDTLSGRLKKQVRDSLVEEQGGLCAYCMCKIPRSDAGKQPPVTIEHFISRNPVNGMNVGQGLDYNNFFAVCHGNRGEKGTRRKRDLTCDAHRENTQLRKVNPLDPATLDSIYYDLQGNICASDPDVEFDLVDTLNLNCPTAPQLAERKAALDSLIRDIDGVLSEVSTVSETLTVLRDYCIPILNGFLAETGAKTPYVGILIWYLQSLLEKIQDT